MAEYDAFLLVSFGGPEGPGDVMPFLRNVTAGRDVPQERLAEVAEHYHRFGGVSPINAQCRDLIGAIEKDFAAAGIDLPVYWGNRNWNPMLADTLAAMAADGVRAPRITKIPPYYRHPGFTGCFARAAREAIGRLPAHLRDDAELVFTAHSIPESMAAASGPAGGAYPAQLAEVAAEVAAALGRSRWRLAYQSRSGPPSARWLEPDVSDCLAEIAQAGGRAVALVPIGFVSDHMEVVFDLDVQAAQVARDLRLELVRARTPGSDPGFVSMITSLVGGLASADPGTVLDALGPVATAMCRAGCCGAGPDRSAGRALAGQ